MRHVEIVHGGKRKHGKGFINFEQLDVIERPDPS